MNSDTSAALGSHVWLWIVLGLIVVAVVLFLRRSSIAALWHSHQETRETEAERRPGQSSRDGTPARSDRDRMPNALDLDALEVSDIMIHRTTMRALNAGDPPEEIVS